MPDPHREGREDQDDEDDPHREDADGRQAQMVRGQCLAVRGQRDNNRAERQAQTSSGPAAHPFTRPVSGSRNCRRHMATVSAGPAKAAKMIAWDNPVDADGRAQEGDDFMCGGRAKRRDEPYPQPVPEPEPEQRAGSASAATRFRPDGCFQPRCQAWRPVRAGRSASTYPARFRGRFAARGIRVEIT